MLFCQGHWDNYYSFSLSPPSDAPRLHDDVPNSDQSSSTSSNLDTGSASPSVRATTSSRKRSSSAHSSAPGCHFQIPWVCMYWRYVHRAHIYAFLHIFTRKNQKTFLWVNRSKFAPVYAVNNKADFIRSWRTNWIRCFGLLWNLAHDTQLKSHGSF